MIETFFFIVKDTGSQTWLRNLRWMMQKDLLGQDVFLIGPPGPLRRNLALSYLELTRREFEYIALTRDTTDSDLKQRREIKNGTSFYHDQVNITLKLGRACLSIKFSNTYYPFRPYYIIISYCLIFNNHLESIIRYFKVVFLFLFCTVKNTL